METVDTNLQIFYFSAHVTDLQVPVAHDAHGVDRVKLDVKLKQHFFCDSISNSKLMT
jgi:hypothetical protein